MLQCSVDLYGHFGVAKPAGAVGELECYIQHTDEAVSPCRLRPAVLILPGGGYQHVSGREGEPIALRYLALGYSAFVLDYSVAPHRFPTALQEAAMAMRFIRENCESLEVNPHAVAAIGFSAGGHLCGLLGTLYDDETVRKIADADMIRPDALGLCYPVAVSWGKTHDGSFENLCGADTGLRQRLSLDKLVRPDMPPVFLWHTRDDACVPCRNSLILANALQEQGVDFTLRVYRSGCHGLSTANAQVYPVSKVPTTSPDVTGWLDAQAMFFEEVGIRIIDREDHE